jgi:hypothetical protein
VNLKSECRRRRINDIKKMAPVMKGHIFFALDALIQKIKIINIAAL